MKKSQEKGKVRVLWRKEEEETSGRRRNVWKKKEAGSFPFYTQEGRVISEIPSLPLGINTGYYILPSL